MPVPTRYSGECPECGEQKVSYWRKDETEHHDEVYAKCRGCGTGFPKKSVDKDAETVEIVEEILDEHISDDSAFVR